MAARKPASAAAPAPEEKSEETTVETEVEVEKTEAAPAAGQAPEQSTDETPDGGETQVDPPEGDDPDGGTTPDDEEPQDDQTEDEYDSFLASLSLATEVHVQVDDRYHPFPAGTRIGDVVNGVEFSEELAAGVTNRKAWVIPTQDD